MIPTPVVEKGGLSLLFLFLVARSLRWSTIASAIASACIGTTPASFSACAGVP